MDNLSLTDYTSRLIAQTALENSGDISRIKALTQDERKIVDKAISNVRDNTFNKNNFTTTISPEQLSKILAKLKGTIKGPGDEDHPITKWFKDIIGKRISSDHLIKQLQSPKVLEQIQQAQQIQSHMEKDLPKTPVTRTPTTIETPIKKDGKAEIREKIESNEKRIKQLDDTNEYNLSKIKEYEEINTFINSLTPGQDPKDIEEKMNQLKGKKNGPISDFHSHYSIYKQLTPDIVSTLKNFSSDNMQSRLMTRTTERIAERNALENTNNSLKDELKATELLDQINTLTIERNDAFKNGVGTDVLAKIDEKIEELMAKVNELYRK